MNKTVLFTAVILLSVKLMLSQTTNFDNIKKHVYALADDDFEGRSISAKGGLKAANYIEAEFKNAGIKPLGDNYYHEFAVRLQHAITAEGKNIVGIVEGSHPQLKNEYIVVGAHYDHVGYKIKKDTKDKVIYNGADDNASGVAAVIELGRAFAVAENKPDRSIVFVAFDGEETGLNGSKWMMNDSIIDPGKIKLMLSLDMIGMLSKAEGIELLGLGSLKDADLVAQQIADKQGINIKKTTKDVHNRTDTKPFGDLGIPAIHFTTGTVSPYHKPEDDAELLDYEGLTKITDYTYAFVEKYAQQESETIVSNLTNNKGALKTKYFTPGLRLNMGSSWHAYPDAPYNGKKGFAIQAGLYAHVKMFGRLYLQPEVVYETMASDHANGMVRTHALTTPVNVLVRFAGNGEMDVWSYFLLGGYYSMNLSGSEGSNDMDFSRTFSDTEYGMNFGFVINVSRVQVGISRKIALSNLYQDKATGNINANALYFNLGLLF